MSKTTVFYNGNFHTMKDDQPTVSAVCCRDGKIIEIGNYSDFSGFTDNAKTVDLKNSFVFPGFIDNYSAPGLLAFKAAATDEKLENTDIALWLDDCRDYLCDKGVATLCLHGENTLFDGDMPQRLITNVTYKTDFEEDVCDDYFDNILDSPENSFLLFSPVFDSSVGVHDAVERLTKTAAEAIGMGSKLGSIEPGKMADFTIFENNPFENDLHTFQRMHASMIVVCGEIVYNADDELMSELYDLLVSQTF